MALCSPGVCDALGPMPSTTDTNKRKRKVGGDREEGDDIEAGGSFFHVNLGYGGRLFKPNTPHHTPQKNQNKQILASKLLMCCKHEP